MIEQVKTTFPWNVINPAIPRLTGNYGREVAAFKMGRFMTDISLELLQRSTVFTRRPEKDCRNISRDGFSPLIMTCGPQRAERQEIEEYYKALSHSGAECFGFIQLVKADGELSAFGWVKDHGKFFPVDVVSFPGPGMTKMSAGLLWPMRPRESKGTNVAESVKDVLLEKWLYQSDRLEGFAGNGNIQAGEGVLLNGAFSSFAIIGNGRMGYELSKHLAKLGAGKRGSFLVVDPDTMEAANLDTIDVPDKFVGQHKAEVTAWMLKMLDSDIQIVPVVGTLSDKDVVRAVASCDFIFICTDNVAARVQAAMIAQMFDRVCFDLTGGSVHTQQGTMTAGGELRISIPASPGCPVCMSGIGRNEAYSQLSSVNGESEWERPVNWQDDGKAGSFKGIISMVVGQASLLFMRLLQSRLASSIWLHLDADGLYGDWDTVTDRVNSSNCPCCSDRFGVRGLGDWWFRNG